MRIKEIELNNFRIYKGVNRISLMPENDKNIVILSGQNGFGKTTFLMSLVWCLHGKNMEQVDAIYKNEITEQGNYTRYIADCMNRKAAAEGEHNFYVKILFSEVNIQGVLCDVSIKRSYDTITGTSDKIEVLLDGYAQELIDNLSQDNKKGEEIFIRDYILPIAIAKFFFFDAEKITALAANNNQKEQRQQLSQAYSEVLGIQKYEILKDNLEEKQDEYRKKSAQTNDKRQLNQLETDIKNTELEIQETDQEIEKLDEQISRHRHISDELSIRLVRAGDKMSVEELRQLNDEKNKLEQQKKDIQNALKESFNYIPFALTGEILANVTEQLENERILSEQKFKQEDIGEKIDRIRQDIDDERCRRNFTVDVKVADFYREQIREAIIKYFSDAIEIDENLKVLHDFSENQIHDFNQLVSSIKNDFKYRFEKLNTEYMGIRNQLAVISRKIRDAERNAQDGRIKDLRDQKDSFDGLIREEAEKIGSLNRKIDELKENLKKLRQEQTAIRKKIDDSTQYSEKAQKTKELIDILAEFITKFKNQKKESLQAKMLESLTQLLHKKDFVQRIDVDIMSSEDIDIVLYGANDEEINKSGLSMGERQLYASALLNSLVSESEIDFPVFIDSPMQKFDKQHAENIIRHFYPNVAKQVVILPLLYKELTEEEYRLLQPKVCRAFLINNTTTDSSEFMETEPSNLFTTYNQISHGAN